MTSITEQEKINLSEYINADIYNTLRTARYENGFITLEQLAETIVASLGREEAQILANNIYKCI